VLGLQLDFAPPRLDRRVALSIAAAAGVLLLWLLSRVFQPAEPLPEQRYPPLPARGSGAAATLQLTQAQIVARDLRIPWGRLFDALESGAAQQVVLSSIEPSVASGSVAIDGIAEDAAAMAAYVGRLADHGLAQPRLLRYQPVPGAEQRLRFVAQAGWYRPGELAAAARATAPAPSLMAAGETHALAAELLQLAGTSGLAVRGVEQEWASESGVAPYASLAFDVSGPYRAVREFANHAVALRPGIAVRQFSLRAAARPDGSVGSPVALQARIELRIHVGGGS
jgi:hypothetical protein